MTTYTDLGGTIKIHVYDEQEEDWGVCKDCTFRNDCRHYKKCKIQCEDYQQECEQTNEEWLHTLNTEQLAEWLSINLCEKVFRCTLIEGGKCKGNDYKEDYNAWLKWLKAKVGKKE